MPDIKLLLEQNTSLLQMGIVDELIFYYFLYHISRPVLSLASNHIKGIHKLAVNYIL